MLRQREQVCLLVVKWVGKQIQVTHLIRKENKMFFRFLHDISFSFLGRNFYLEVFETKSKRLYETLKINNNEKIIIIFGSLQIHICKLIK